MQHPQPSLTLVATPISLILAVCLAGKNGKIIVRLKPTTVSLITAVCPCLPCGCYGMWIALCLISWYKARSLSYLATKGVWHKPPGEQREKSSAGLIHTFSLKIKQNMIAFWIHFWSWPPKSWVALDQEANGDKIRYSALSIPALHTFIHLDVWKKSVLALKFKYRSLQNLDHMEYYIVL